MSIKRKVVEYVFSYIKAKSYDKWKKTDEPTKGKQY